MSAPDVRDAREAGFRTALLVVVVGLVVAWFALPREARSEPAYGDLPPGTPLRVVAHTIGLDAHVVPVAVSPDGVLDPPDDYRLVGWRRGSARPGAEQGQTVLTGHSVHTGGGSMNRVGRLRPGQKVDVVTGKGRMRYEVSRVRVLSHPQLARAAARLFGQGHGDGRLLLVSCTRWDGREYTSNVVVTAAALGTP